MAAVVSRGEVCHVYVEAVMLRIGALLLGTVRSGSHGSESQCSVRCGPAAMVVLSMVCFFRVWQSWFVKVSPSLDG